MRHRMLALSAVLALAAACDKEPAAQDARSADQQLARDDLETNDLTAIDAASGADSNMAADIDIANLALNEDDAASPANGQPSRRPRAQPAARDDATKPASDSNESAPPETEDGAN